LKPERWALAGYAALLRLLLPAYLLRLWWRGRVEPAYRERIAERLGHYAEPPSTGWVWVHAVSLGETRAAAALVDALRGLRPGMRLLLTHGTATGREAGAALLRHGDRQTWLPYDTPGAVERFLMQFRPVMGVLMETEVWPTLLLGAQRHGVPMVLANARLSERSFRQGLRWRWLLHRAARSLTLVLAQTEDDARRLHDSGAPVVEVCGNLKFDLTPDPAQLALGASWRAMLGRPVVLAAITREGEEAPLLDAWIRRGEVSALLLIVPRHPQRFDEVARLVQERGLSLARRSSWDRVPSAQALQARVWLGDSMREMPTYYACARVALLGGSFAPLGGHNLIEAAACSCPLLMGPSTFNFKEAAELSLAAGAALRVGDVTHAVSTVGELLAQPDRLVELSRAALHFAAAHRGAAQRMAQRIVALVSASSD